MKYEDKNTDKADNNTIHNVSHSCFDCKHLVSTQPDIICHIWCDITDRDFTFGKGNSEICERFEED